MAKFRQTVKQTDKLLAFVQAVAAGTPQFQAYLDHYTTAKPTKKTAEINASKLLARSQVRRMLEQAKKARVESMTRELEKSSRVLAKEFLEKTLAVEELDAFHTSVIMGNVDVEEVVPVQKVEHELDVNGRVTKTTRKVEFVRIKRPPNVREKQISVDALYKRFGSYAPVKVAGRFRHETPDGDESETVERVIILANGSKLPLP